MYRIRSLAAGRRGVLFVLLAAAAVLTVAAFVVEPPHAQRGDAGGGSSTTEPAAPQPDIVDLDAVVGPTADEQRLADEELERGQVGGEAIAPEVGGAAPSRAVAPRDGDISAVLEPGSAAPDIDARIVRTGSIALRLREGRFEEGWSDAHAVAGAFGGYVVGASRSGAGDGPRLGTITMRVPSERFDAAVERLRGLDRSKVERLDVTSQDVTQEYTDVRSRLRHDRAVERRLLALLAQTKGVSEVLAVQSRLDQVQEEIEVSTGRLQVLEKLTAMSTIEVTLREPGASTDDTDDDRPVLAEAWEDARERFAENVAGALVWAGGALPALLLFAVIAAVARVAWRRSERRRAARAGSESTS